MGFSENLANWPKPKHHPNMVNVLLLPELARHVGLGSKSVLTKKNDQGLFSETK